MSDENNEEKKPKSKSFKNLADLLNVDDNNAFDANEAEDELKKLEERKKEIEEYKKKFEEIQNCPNTDEYMGKVLKELVGKGMAMLDALQREIEDCPRGRDVETAAAMMAAVNGVIDNINKIKVSQAKIEFEKQKIDIRKAALNGPQNSQNPNVLMVGTTQDLMNLLMKNEMIPDNNKIKTIEAEVVKETSKTQEDKSSEAN